MPSSAIRGSCPGVSYSAPPHSLHDETNQNIREGRRCETQRNDIVSTNATDSTSIFIISKHVGTHLVLNGYGNALRFAEMSFNNASTKSIDPSVFTDKIRHQHFNAYRVT